ncbi:MAG: DUF3553 domain-containing protein [Phycisphaerales bacterium]|nr:DUF3553 domain-containing protein [Phycisphaerales bacterium]
MSAAPSFKFGDRVVHMARPEWGIGVITAAQAITDNGRPCQRLTIRFDREGLKTLSTAFAHLRPAEHVEFPAGTPAHPAPAAAPAAAPATPPGEAPAATAGASGLGWLATLEGGNPAERMAHLPEPATDPFSTLAARLKATLELYRFSDAGRSLLDWAAMQTGLKDPLTRFNRHELEVFFKRFAIERDDHLKKLVAESQRKEPGLLDRLAGAAGPDARSALRRIHAGR